MYSYCPSWALSWDYRKKGIMEEIRHYSADIINLQEVEMDQFYNFFLPELKQDGYAGIYSPKSRAKTMAENERKFVDGCAVFYRTAKFTLIKEHLVEFNQLAMANADGLEHMLNRVMPKDNIGLAALLQTTEAAWENGKSFLLSLSQVNLFFFYGNSTTRFCDRPTTVISVYGAHPLGSGILRRQADPDDDAEQRTERHPGGIGADVARQGQLQHRTEQHPIGTVRRFQFVTGFGRHRVLERRQGVAGSQGLQGFELQVLPGEDTEL